MITGTVACQSFVEKEENVFFFFFSSVLYYFFCGEGTEMFDHDAGFSHSTCIFFCKIKLRQT